ncbi:hypothetical protein G6F61_014623 [Rhizopus arrhizus]|nr:hypothetical protein G6F61_014623 [Rhizopus arrhizus]
MRTPRRIHRVVAALQWQPWDWLSLTAGGRFIDYRTRDRNRVAFVSESRDLRYTFARRSKGGQLLPGWYKEWYPDAQGNYTYDSLRATPYGDSTLGQAEKQKQLAELDGKLASLGQPASSKQ